MAQISRLPLPKAMQNQMYELFYKVLADLKADGDIEILLDDLLTPTEKVMIAKRLAVAFLLEKGYDQRTVHSMMRVSLSTVNTVNFWLKNKGAGYRKAIAMVRREEKWRGFVNKLDGILEDFLSVRKMRKRIHSMPYKEPSSESVF